MTQHQIVTVMLVACWIAALVSSSESTDELKSPLQLKTLHQLKWKAGGVELKWKTQLANKAHQKAVEQLSSSVNLKSIQILPENETCEDTNSVDHCSYWETLGYCDISSEWYSYMEDNCTATCGLCGGYITIELEEVYSLTKYYFGKTLEPGDYLEVHGTYVTRTSRTGLNIVDDDDDILLHVSFRPESATTVLNSRYNGVWQDEVRADFPEFVTDDQFKITIVCMDAHYNIFVNDELLSTFPYRMELSTATSLIPWGDSMTWDLIKMPGEYTDLIVGSMRKQPEKQHLWCIPFGYINLDQISQSYMDTISAGHILRYNRKFGCGMATSRGMNAVCCIYTVRNNRVR